MTLKEIRERLQARGTPGKAALLQRFFKTGPGQYGEGDLFLGVKVPETRQLLRYTDDLKPGEVSTLLQSHFHEERLLALLILVRRFQRAKTPDSRHKIFTFYFKHTASINNWDLVDLSAPQIVGVWLLDRSRALLYQLATSPSLWQRRIAVVATHAFIREGQFNDTLELCRQLLGDKHDLMHKACGWMLREVGKRHQPTLRQFLDQYATRMPRTMLRYAIEHLSASMRRHYMKRPAKS